MWIWCLVIAIAVWVAEANVSQWVIWMRRLRGNVTHEDM